MEGEGRLVCVTGGSGFIASWLVKVLLQRGYAVRATVRNPNDPRKTEHLLALDGATTRLKLFQAELLEKGSFDRIVDGCEGVFHTASPVQISNIVDPQAELIDRAVKGTLNVLASCAKASSVKRVVLTSSMAAVAYNERILSPDVVVDETWFSDLAFLEKLKIYYLLSKTLAEEAAWKYAKQNGINMVSINPGLTIGPILQPTVNATVELVLNFINGSKSFTEAHHMLVDVRDVADAHIRAFVDPSTIGRYCLVHRSAYSSELVETLRKLYPELDIPKRCEGVSPLKMKYDVDNTKAKGLGVVFTPLEVSLKDTVESLIQKNLHTNGPSLANNGYKK